MDLQIIQTRIVEIRGQRVMLDFHLAELYEVETNVLKQAVRRNHSRFPEDFMFELSEEEEVLLRSQFATLERGRYSRYPPFAFSEHGILMLSGVLKSDKAIRMSIHIIEIFVQLRKLAYKYDIIYSKIQQMELKNQKKFGEIFKILKSVLVKPNKKATRKIGNKK